MTHIDALVAAVLAALDRPAVAGPVNVADATPVAPVHRKLGIAPDADPIAEAARLVASLGSPAVATVQARARHR